MRISKALAEAQEEETRGNPGHPGPLRGGTVLLQGLEVGVSRLGGGRWGGEETSQQRGEKVQPPLAFVGLGEVDLVWALTAARLLGFASQVGRQAGVLGRARPGHL